MQHRTPLILRTHARGGELYAARSYQPGEVVFRLGPLDWRAAREPGTVRHPAGGYVFHPLLAQARHDGAPNCGVSFAERALAAIRPILAGEPIVIDPLAPERGLRAGAGRR